MTSVYNPFLIFLGALCMRNQEGPTTLPGHTVWLQEGEDKKVPMNCTEEIMNKTHSDKVVLHLDMTHIKQKKKEILKLPDCWDRNHQNDTVQSSIPVIINVSYSQQHLTITGLKAGSYYLEALYKVNGYGTDYNMPICVNIFPKGKGLG